jgi:hypothetical protein
MRLHVGTSLLLHVEMLGNRTVCPTFTAAPRNCHRDHAPPPLSQRLLELFHLYQFGKPSPSLSLSLSLYDYA